MASTQDRYQTLDIYICKETYEPKGICYGKTCKPKSISETEETLSKTVKTYVNGVLVSEYEHITARHIQVDAYIALVGFDNLNIAAYILPNGADEACLLSTPSCSEFDPLEADVKWSRSDDNILAVLPLPEHCAVEKFLTIYPDNTQSYTTLHTSGKLTVSRWHSHSMTAATYCTKCHWIKKRLIPGELVSVSYKLNGFSEYHLLGVIDFQTNIFTRAKLVGHGLVEKIKVYNNPAKPELGYSYEYRPVEGGIGKALEDVWIYDTRLRFAVEYRGEVYWLKSVDFSRYEPDSKVTIVRSIHEAPITPRSGYRPDMRYRQAL